MKNRLRVLRAERDGMTQLQLSLKTKINQSKLSLIENGHIEASDDERVALATALESTVAELFPVAVAEQQATA